MIKLQQDKAGKLSAQCAAEATIIERMRIDGANWIDIDRAMRRAALLLRRCQKQLVAGDTPR